MRRKVGLARPGDKAQDLTPDSLNARLSGSGVKEGRQCDQDKSGAQKNDGRFDRRCITSLEEVEAASGEGRHEDDEKKRKLR